MADLEALIARVAVAREKLRNAKEVERQALLRAQEANNEFSEAWNALRTETNTRIDKLDPEENAS